jgi:2,4'-dihydroxyacetophenone dioxygenase
LSAPGPGASLASPRRIWLDEEGQASGTFDVFDYIEMCRSHYEKVGIGATYIDRLFR